MIEHSADKTGGARPPFRAGLKSRVKGISKEACDRNIRNSYIIEDVAVVREFRFQIVESPGDFGVQTVFNALLIAALAPDKRANDLLIEESPDEQVAKARICKLLKPARMRPFLG